VFPPDQTAELSTPAGRRPPRADVASAADSIPDGRSQHRAPNKVGVWEEGAVINERYELERRLGSGSMGEVFLARDRLLKKPVALKVLRGDMAKNRGTVRRFLREVALAHSVTHPNVVRIYDTGETGGLPYFSMEYLQGQTLEQLIDASSPSRAGRAEPDGEERSEQAPKEPSKGELGDPPMTLQEIREISYEILSGLTAAHEAGIVHRDLKPANVMLTHRGAIVMDFGVAGFDAPTPGQRPNPAEARSLVRTEAGTIFGSPAYMAPELWEGSPSTVQSDLYSFGVMLYQMLSGRLPIEAPNAKAFLIKLKDEKPTPVRQLRKDTPWNLALLVARCMDHDADKRPVSADAAAKLVAPLASRWRFIVATLLVLMVALVIAGFVWGASDEGRFREMGLPDTVAEADIDAVVRSYDVGDYDAALRQLERLEIRAPESAAVVFWRATLEHELRNEAARWSYCEEAGYDPESEGEQWQGSASWREQAMSACALTYSTSAQMRALLDPDEAHKLPESWLPLAVSTSLVPRLEAAREPVSSVMREAEHVLQRLDEPHDFREGPALAMRWQIARLEVRLALGRYDEVRNLLDDLLTEHPEAPIVLSWAANFYTISGELDRAEQWARAVADYDPRPALRLLLDSGELIAGTALIDRYATSPGPHPYQQQLIDTWCGYAWRFELDVPPQRCGAVGPGLVHNVWISLRTDNADQAAMSSLEKAIVTQQLAINRGECLGRGQSDGIISRTLPPFETYLRQLDISLALCFSGQDTGPDLELARRLADELHAIAPGDPWALLIAAQVDEARMSTKPALDKRRKVVERWRRADDNLPLVRDLRVRVGEPPGGPGL
jgi:tetratricopeptide (TPR) repeat protein